MAIFKNVYYDHRFKKIHLWELEDNGTTSYKILDYSHDYYILDRTKRSNIKSIFGEPVIKKIANNKEELALLKESGERLFESDLNEVVKFLQERYGNQEYKIDMKNYNIYNLDIENEYPVSETINLIGLENYHTGEIFQFGLQPYSGEDTNKTYYYCKSEEELLTAFCKFLKYKKVEYITGWNVHMFDIPKIQDRLDYHQLKCSLSPIGKITRKNDGSVDIAGICILDGMELYKKFTFKNQPSFSLDFIGNLEVGEGKIGYEGAILDFWRTDWNRFCDYNVQDLKLCGKIDNKKKFVALAVGMGTDSRIPFNKVLSPISVIEGDLIKELHANNMVLEDISHNIDFEKTRKIEGGHVETYPGFHKYQLSIDAESMYPHNIMMYNISKETKVVNPSIDEIPNLIKSHLPGIYYRKEQGIMPRITKKTFDERKSLKKKMFAAKKEHNYDLADYYDSQQMIRKIKINSIFGASANPYFHFYDFDNASEITAGGRDSIQYVAKCIDDYFSKEFYKVSKRIYPNSTLNDKSVPNRIRALLDTDSVYFNVGSLYHGLKTETDFLTFSLEFEEKVLKPFLKNIMDIYAERYNTKNLLNFKREKIILKNYVQAKKKYACYSIANEDEIYDKPKLSVTGIETKKSDLCKFSRERLDKLLKSMFEDEEPNKERMLKIIRTDYEEMKKQTISEIALPKGIGDYDKYFVDISSNQSFIKGTPIFNRASIYYNHIIKEYNLPYVEIRTGTKMKYVFVKDNNKYKTNVVGFVGNWPEEFNKIFTIDYDEIFEKQYMNIAQRMFDTLGFGLVTLKESKLMKMFEDDE